jgi:hypothetical protein
MPLILLRLSKFLILRKGRPKIVSTFSIDLLFCSCYNQTRYIHIREVAQWLAHSVWDRGVAGSNPVFPTYLPAWLVFYF